MWRFPLLVLLIYRPYSSPQGNSFLGRSKSLKLLQDIIMDFGDLGETYWLDRGVFFGACLQRMF